MYVAHSRPGLTTGRSKRAEVTLSEQRLCLRMHYLCIQRPAVPGELPMQQGGAYGSVTDNVAIWTWLGGKPSVKLAAHLGRPNHPDIIWQMGIATHYPGFEAAGRRWVKVNDLGAGMHTCIRTPGTMHSHRLVCNPTETALQLGLYG